MTRLQRYLDYRAICSGDAINAARADYQNVARERLIEKTLPEAWHRLVDDEDELLLELIGDRVESLCGYKPDPDMVMVGWDQSEPCGYRPSDRDGVQDRGIALRDRPQG